MTLRCGPLDNLVLEARLDQETPCAPGRTLVVLESDEILRPADTAFGGFSIAEATAAEREALWQADYRMPDGDPARRQIRLRDLGVSDDG